MFVDESQSLQSNWSDSAEVERHLADRYNPLLLAMMEWKPKVTKRPG